MGGQINVANGLNQFTLARGVGFAYDARGNMSSDGVNAYGYDILNRLIARGSATLGYDPAGRLYQSVAAGVTTRMLYDGAAMIGEYNGLGALQRRFVHGPGMDEPLVWYEGAGVSDRRWLVADERGSIVAVTNAAGAATNINAYDEYGVPGASNVGRFQYTGQMWLSEVGVYHYKARAYAPSLGRFLQTDPIGTAGGVNLYAYVGNDPVNFSDPWGLFDCRETPVSVPYFREIVLPNGDLGFEGGWRTEWRTRCGEGNGFSLDQARFHFIANGSGLRGLLGLETGEGPLVPRELSRCERTALAQFVAVEDLNSARIWEGRVPTWLRSGSRAVTLGNNIYVRGSIGLGLLGHELRHVQQNRIGLLNPLTYGAASGWSAATAGGDTDANNPFERDGNKLQRQINAASLAACTDTPGRGG